jgi:hypothetical protein
MHWCPACQALHMIAVAPSPVSWSFNEDLEKPTFSPSIRCFTTYSEGNELLPNGETRTLCHYFLTEGEISYCSDSPHALAGQKVPLPELPAHLRDGSA